MSSLTIDHLLTIGCDLIQRVYAEAPDDDGTQPVDETIVDGVLCELQQAGSREEQGGAVQITTYRLFLGAGNPLRGWDAVYLHDTGETLELEGDAFVVRSPITGIEHVEAVVRRTDYGQAQP